MNQNGKKDFDGWIKIKKEIHFKGSIRTIKEGEIWWCKIGENVGKEIWLGYVSCSNKISPNQMIRTGGYSRKSILIVSYNVC